METAAGNVKSDALIPMTDILKQEVPRSIVLQWKFQDNDAPCVQDVSISIVPP